MAVALLSKTVLAQIDTLILDASVSENHQIEVEVTDHPVEVGADMTDHRRRKPYKLTMEGIVTNTPLPKDSDPVQSLTAPTGSGITWQSRGQGDPTLATTAYLKLLDLADSARLLTIITALKTYENMTVTSIDVPRNAQIGQALRFTAQLREIRLVRNDTAQVIGSSTRANGVMDLHKKTKTESKVDNRTIALQIQEDGVQKTVTNLIHNLTGQ